ncbi:proteinase-activated receptor 1-like [Limanda limanda]|uniref:proteinase-activated receptor 1-like n=1 Tax=Limanda limanda TaxID=27771 RepID=UPI0029C90F2E|nr:proteinase-activated receptor 1-like [Limanda limanda]
MFSASFDRWTPMKRFFKDATRPSLIPDEYFNNRSWIPDEYNDYINGTGLLNETSTQKVKISEEALLFLTGSVSTILIPSFYTLICLLSLPINICAVVAFALKIKPKKPAAIYMLNLACADLLFAVLLPFKIFYHFGGNNWIFGLLMCRVVTAAFYWNMYCSVLLITCISVDRLLGVVYPLDSLPWRTPGNTIMACVAMWILSFAGTVPLVLHEQTFPLSQLNITTCHDVQSVHKEIWFNKIFFIALCCAFFFLPLLITVVSYTRVIWALSRVPRSVLGRSRRRKRAVVMAGTVLVIFVLCFTPTNCLLMAYYLQFNGDAEASKESNDGSYAAYLVLMCLGSLNCLLDPLVYYFGSSQCQKQLSSTLRCEKILEGCSGHSFSSLSSRLTRMRTT